MIDEYNAGSINVETFFKKLVEFSQLLKEEDRRAIKENLNEEELAMLCGWYGCPPPMSMEPDAIAVAARALFGRLELDRLLVTLGPRGALAADAQGITRGAAPRPVQLVDTVGAGDSFSAVVLAGSLRGWGGCGNEPPASRSPRSPRKR